MGKIGEVGMINCYVVAGLIVIKNQLYIIVSINTNQNKISVK